MATGDYKPNIHANGLDGLFTHALQDIYGAERSARNALDKLADAATLPGLKVSLCDHSQRKESQLRRLSEVLELLGQPVLAIECLAMTGILREGEQVLETFGKLDAAVIFIMQGVNHYEVARYATLQTWAHELGYDEPALILSALHGEEVSFGGRLAKILMVANAAGVGLWRSGESAPSRTGPAPGRQA